MKGAWEEAEKGILQETAEFAYQQGEVFNFLEVDAIGNRNAVYSKMKGYMHYEEEGNIIIVVNTQGIDWIDRVKYIAHECGHVFFYNVFDLPSFLEEYICFLKSMRLLYNQGFTRRDIIVKETILMMQNYVEDEYLKACQSEGGELYGLEPETWYPRVWKFCDKGRFTVPKNNDLNWQKWVR